MNRRYQIWVLSLILITSILTDFTIPIMAQDQNEVDSSIALTITDQTITMSMTGYQQWVFEKDQNLWKFTGVKTWNGSTWELFINNSGKFILGNGFDDAATAYTILSDTSSKKTIKFTGSVGGDRAHDFEWILEMNQGDLWVKRQVNVRFTSEDEVLNKGEMGLSLYTDYFINNENGVIATHEPSRRDYDLPYAFPAIMSQFKGTLEKPSNYDFAMLVDMDETVSHSELTYAKRAATIYNNFELGLVNKAAIFMKDKWYKNLSYYYMKENSQESFFKLIDKTANKYWDINEYPSHILENQLTYKVSDYKSAVTGLTRDLTDLRAKWHDGIGLYKPYSYGNGVGNMPGTSKSAWTESFGTMDVLKGMLRYAKWSGDQALEQKAVSELLQLCQAGWIGNAHNTENFFHWTWDGDFEGDTDGHEEAANALSTWKYYDRVLLMGEMAKITGNETIKSRFLDMVPFVNTLRYDGYKQAVTYDLDTHQPITGVDLGGSGGGGSMWAYIHYLAYELSGNATYLEDANQTMAIVNGYDYFNMLSMRSAPKPIALSWAIRANVKAYEINQDPNYLDRAEEISGGLYASMYLGNHPNTPFPIYGFAYAGTKERWEAYREIVEPLWVAAPLFEYRFDPTLAKMYLLAKQTQLWALPINGNPYGRFDRGLDSMDGAYIPFEFPTGDQGDNFTDNGEGGQSAERQTKEGYGAGEVYMAHQMFEAWGKASDPEILILDIGAVSDHYSDSNHVYRVYNTSNHPSTFWINFEGYAPGNYSIKIEQSLKGTYNNQQMENGISFTLEGNSGGLIHVDPSQEIPGDLVIPNPVSNLNLSQFGTSQMKLEWQTAQPEDFSHYMIYRSEEKDFETNMKTLIGSTKETYYTDDIREQDNYYYKVTQVDGHGNESLPSKEVKALVNIPHIGWLEDFKSVIDWQTEGARIETDQFVAKISENAADLPYGNVNRSLTYNVTDYPMIEINVASLSDETKWALKVVKDGVSTTLQADTNRKGLLVYDLKSITGWSGDQSFTLQLWIVGDDKAMNVEWLRAINLPQDITETFEDVSDWVEVTASINALDGIGRVTEASPNLPYGYVKKRVVCDLDQTPYMEIAINQVENGGLWALKVNDGSEDLNLMPDTDKEGTFVLDVAHLTGWTGVKVFDLIFYTVGEGVSVDVDYIRPLAAFYEDFEEASDWDPKNVVLSQEEGRIKLTEQYAQSNYGSLDKVVTYNIDRYPYLEVCIPQIEVDDDINLVSSWAIKVNDGVNEIELKHPEESTYGWEYFRSKVGTYKYNLKEITGWSGNKNMTIKIYVIGEGKSIWVDYIKADFDNTYPKQDLYQVMTYTE